MKDTSEDEQQEDFMASNGAYPRTSATSERAKQLRKMMEDEGRNISPSECIDLMTDEAHRRRDGRQPG